MSDAIMPRIMDTVPPSLWSPAIRATVAHITSSHTDNHVLDFMQEDIPPNTINLNDHNALTNLWAQRIFTEEELSTLLESSLDTDIEPQYDALTQRLNAINRKMWDVHRLSTFLVHANNSHKHPARTLITDASEVTNTGCIDHDTHSNRRTREASSAESSTSYPEFKKCSARKPDTNVIREPA